MQINPKWDCSGTPYVALHSSGNTFDFGILNNRDLNGAWCDDPSKKSRNLLYYICSHSTYTGCPCICLSPILGLRPLEGGF